MKYTHIKYHLSFLFALVMVFSMMAFPVAAAAGNVALIQERINAVLDSFGITDDMTDDKIADAIIAADGATAEAAAKEIAAIDTDAQSLAEEEIAQLNTALYERFCNIWNRLFTPLPVTDVSMLDGALTISDNQNTGSVSGTTYTATVTSSTVTRKTNTITITNKSGSKATLSFDYNANNIDTSESGGFTLNNDVTSGTYSILLDANATLTFSFRAPRGFGNKTATLTLSNVSITAAAENSNVTIQFDSGSVTVDGTGVANNSVNQIPVTGKTIAATSTNFVGWIDVSTNKILSTAASFTLQPASDMTIKAIHGPTARFLVGSYAVGGYLFETLSEATAYASTASTKTVVLANTGTLPADKDYTIPSGVQLLIPNSASDTGAFGKEPSIQLSTNPVDTPAYAFRVLTVPSTTTITCEGEINVNGHRSDNGQPFCGTAVGGYGQIILGTESTTFSDPDEEDLTPQLIIANGGKLYCYGYITGSGMVQVENGGTVHELLQMGDWPGGSNGTGWEEGDSKQFLLSQYYVQNIESPFKVKYGGTVNFEGVLTASTIELKVSSAFIGTSSGLFQIKSTNGYVFRIYDQSRDRMNYHIENGTFTFGNVTLQKNMIIANIDIDSANSILPIANNLSIYIGSGATMNMGNQSAILPGAEVIIEEGATANLTNNIYIYDVSDWSGTTNTNGTYSQSMFFNRVAQGITDKWWPSSGNTNPQSNPLPYVATQDGVSPAASGFYSAGGSSTGYNQTDPKPITTSGKLVVNGTLNVESGGALYTTTGGSSANKAITGTGKIDYTAGTIGTAGTITVGTGDYETTVNVGPAVANLAGFDSLQSFGKYIYYGQSNGYWYNHVISTDQAYNVSRFTGIPSLAQTGLDTTTVKPYGKEEISNVLGFVTYDLRGTQSAFSFTTTNYNVTTKENTAAVASNADTADNEWDYTLSTVTADTVLLLDPARVILATIEAAYDAEIVMRYGLDIPQELLAQDSAMVRLTKPSAWDGDMVTEYSMAALRESGKNGYGYYTVNAGVASGEMAREIKIEVFNSDGTAQNVYNASGTDLGTAPGYAIKYYGQLTYAHGDDDQKTMMDALLTYGGYAQKHFNVDADKPVYDLIVHESVNRTALSLDGITKDTINAATEKPAESEIGITVKSLEPNLDSRTFLELTYVVDEGENFGDYTFELTYRANNKDHPEVITENSTRAEIIYDETSRLCYVRILDIPAAYLDYMYQIKITDETGADYTVKTSVMCWVKQVLTYSTNQNQINLAKAMYLYNDAANTFFAKRGIT